MSVKASQAPQPTSRDAKLKVARKEINGRYARVFKELAE
jgi:hypothetical protein